MKRLNWAAAALGLVALSGCVAPVWPVGLRAFTFPIPRRWARHDLGRTGGGSDGSSL